MLANIVPKRNVVVNALATICVNFCERQSVTSLLTFAESGHVRTFVHTFVQTFASYPGETRRFDPQNGPPRLLWDPNRPSLGPFWTLRGRSEPLSRPLLSAEKRPRDLSQGRLRPSIPSKSGLETAQLRSATRLRTLLGPVQTLQNLLIALVLGRVRPPRWPFRQFVEQSIGRCALARLLRRPGQF